MRSSAIVFITVFGLFCVLPSPSTSNPTMTFKMKCKEKYQNWCANLYLYETHANEVVMDHRVCALPGKHATISMDVIGWQIAANVKDYYKMIPMVSHNCSSTGEYFCGTLPSPFKISVSEQSDVSMSLALSQVGDTKGVCKHPEPTL